MFLKRTLFAGFMWLSLQGNAYSAGCDEAVTCFLIAPTKENYLSVITSLANSEQDNCWQLICDIQSVEKKSQEREQLWTLVRQGNEWAIRLVAISLARLSGGALEDAFRILGESLDSKPEILLMLFGDKTIDQRSFENCLTMLPLSIVDSRNLVITELRRREKIIAEVNNTQLVKPKKIAISILKNEVLSINKIWPEQD